MIEQFSINIPQQVLDDLNARSRFKNFLLDIRTINDIQTLNTSAGFRSIGSRPQEIAQFTEINLKSIST